MSAPVAKAKPAPPIDISSDAFAAFATRVQPILMNTCVSCHSGGRGGNFQLVATDGGQRASTQANLAAVLEQVRTDNPALSPLFIKALSRHGNAAGAPLKDRQAIPYRTLQGWVDYLLATNWRSGRLRNILLTICTALIILIGPSRVYLGAHWPSDVMAGYIYGGLWFGGLMALYLRIKAWIHPPVGKTPEVMKPLQQPGDEDSVEA